MLPAAQSVLFCSGDTSNRSHLQLGNAEVLLGALLRSSVQEDGPFLDRWILFVFFLRLVSFIFRVPVSLLCSFFFSSQKSHIQDSCFSSLWTGWCNPSGPTRSNIGSHIARASQSECSESKSWELAQFEVRIILPVNDSFQQDAFRSFHRCPMDKRPIVDDVPSKWWFRLKPFPFGPPLKEPLNNGLPYHFAWHGFQLLPILS